MLLRLLEIEFLMEFISLYDLFTPEISQFVLLNGDFEASAFILNLSMGVASTGNREYSIT